MNEQCAKIYPTNPLGIIALFVFLNETLATVTLKFMLEAESPLALPMTVFVMSFPLLVSAVFFLILWRKKEVLYAPGDFRTDEAFLQSATERLTEKPHLIREVFSRLIQSKSLMDTMPTAESSTIDYTTALVTAQTALSRDSKIDVPYSINLLENIRSERPHDRAIAIYLGRLYRRLGDFDRAILTLRNFIDGLKSSKSVNSKRDMGDAYYNIACYHSLKAADGKKNDLMKDEVGRLTEEAMESLRQAITLNPENKKFAKVDSDLDFIKKAVQHLVDETP